MDLRIYKSDTETVIAESPEAALELCREQYGEDIDLSEFTFAPRTSDKDLSLTFEERMDVPETVPESARKPHEKWKGITVVTMSEAGFVEHFGRGWLGTTEW